MTELAGLLVLGFLAQWLSWRIKVPAILPLIIIGLLVGSISTFFTPDGQKLIDGDGIFQEGLLFDAISISVGLILFEGGLTLKVAEVKRLVGTVGKIVLLGAAITLIGSTIATQLLLNLNFATSLLFSSLIIVTGPTVIGPILRNVRPNFNISTILKWEGILIDPIGALIAILIYEYLAFSDLDQNFLSFATKSISITIVVGTASGASFAFLIYHLLKKDLIPKYLHNVVIMALVIMSFTISDAIHTESGLLAVTLLGIILGNTKIEGLKEILSFKQDVTIILISILFITLSSRIDIKDLQMLANWKILILFMVIIWVVRPIAIFVSTMGSGLNFREKIFISWISPRGIVAAGVASIFALSLAEGAAPNPRNIAGEFLLPLTFMMIVGTVIIQGLTAKIFAKKLDVTRKKPSGILFLGANEPARYLAHYLRNMEVSVLLADTSRANIREAKADRFEVYEGSLLSDEALENIDFSRYGQLFATTPNTDINILACKILSNEIGKNNVFRLASPLEVRITDLEKPTNLLFSATLDYISVTQLSRKRPQTKEFVIEDRESFESFLEHKKEKIIPLFVQKNNHRFEPFSNSSAVNLEEDKKFIYIEQASNKFF